LFDRIVNSAKIEINVEERIIKLIDSKYG